MNERMIGENIRRTREARGLTVTETARRAGLSKSALSKIETGNASPPISTLLRIGEALEVQLATLFAEPDARPDFVITRRGEGERIVRDGSQFGYAYEALALGMPGKHAEPFLLTINPDDPAGHFQHGGEEFMYILSGKLDFTIGEHSTTLGPGDSIYFDPREKHSSKAVGKTPARFLSIFIQSDLGGKPGSRKSGGKPAKSSDKAGARSPKNSP